MERSDPVISQVGVEGNYGRVVGNESARPALNRPLPLTPAEIFRDLGMSRSEIAAYFRRFPDLHRA
jgi:hypothetical protein